MKEPKQGKANRAKAAKAKTEKVGLKKRHLRAVSGAPRAVRAQRARSDDGNAFIPDPADGPAHASDDLAEALAEDFIEAATRGNDVLEDDLDQALPDEVGGPFVVTRARDELAFDVDASNPPGATVEPLPKPMAGLVQRPRVDGATDGRLEDDDQDEDDDIDDEEPDVSTFPDHGS